MIRTDMAMEILKPDRKQGVLINAKGGNELVNRTDVTIETEEASRSFGRQMGKYITVDVKRAYRREPDLIQKAGKVLSSAILDLIDTHCAKVSPRVLVAGLGNRGMTADALGHKVVERLIVTRHLFDQNDEGMGKLSSMCAICPNVMGVTGIESYDIILGTVERVKPDCVIVVDTLASRKTERLSSAFQITDTGITPGSGVGNHRFSLNASTLGVPVIAIGVPLVVYASTIVDDVLSLASESDRECFMDIEKSLIDSVIGDLVVTPKDIDVIVNDCAYIIALAINSAVHKKLPTTEILKLMNH